jgi:hypothetical protein
VKMSNPESIATEIVINAKNAQKANPKPSSAVRVVGPKVTDLSRRGAAARRPAAWLPTI